MKLLRFTPISKPPRTYDLLAFDTEGTGAAGDFKLAATYDASGANVFRSPRQLQAYLFQKRFRDARIIAANLEYDVAVAFQPFSSAWEILLTYGKWLAAFYRDDNRNRWTLWDAQRIAPITVAEMGAIIGCPKWATPPVLLSGETRPTPEWQCDQHHRLWCVECYCVRDAEITWKFIRQFQQTLNDLGGELRATTASCAMDLFRRVFLREEIAATFPEHNHAARYGYYGGRVECLKPGTARDVHVYDVNSLYPAVMREMDVPLPHTYVREYAPLNVYRRLDHVGMYVGSVSVPSSYIPPLPYRYGHRVVYPCGTWRGAWTFAELREALAHGARLVHAEMITYATETKKLFREYVDTLYARRQLLRAGGRSDQYVIKTLLNSLYGKFGQRSDGGLERLIVPRGDYDLETYADCEPIELLGRECFLRTAARGVQSPHVHVLWAAEIAARARGHLLRLMLDDPAQLHYVDTDALHTTARLATADTLGALKLERVFARVTYYAPKEYAGLDCSGRLWTKVKGIPPRLHQEYLEQGRVEFSRPNHTLTAIRSGGRIAEWQKSTKARQTNPPTRAHPPIADYNQDWVDSWPFDAGVVPVVFDASACGVEDF